MKIQKIISRNRRDFVAKYICEHCTATVTTHGYDDAHFHNEVVPAMVCKICGKTAGIDYLSLATKYDAEEVV